MKKKFFLTAFLLMLGVSLLFGQSRTITGTVTSAEDGLGMPGVSVIIKGSAVGVATDFDGNYSLSVPDGSEILVFSFVGMVTQEVAIAGRSILNVIMKTEAFSLQEVVVTGLGAPTDRRKVAIAVESVSEKDLKRVPNSTIDNALIGRVAGAQIQSTSGQPGQQANIILRGINTLTSTQPMILIDGVEVNASNSEIGSGNMSSRLSDLDLSNVERVEIVQGSAAATIYGAQGANGVIQIFTKKGRKSERADISYSSLASFDNILRGNFSLAKNHYFQTDAQGYILDQTGANRITQDPIVGYWFLPDETISASSNNNKPFMEKTYDHLDQYFKKNALTLSNSLNITGASDKIDYAMGFSLYNQESPINGKLDRKNISLNVGSEIFKNFKVRSSTQLIRSHNTTGGVNNVNSVFSGMGGALMVPQYIDLSFKDAMGNHYVSYDEHDNSVLPFYSHQFRVIEADVNRIIEGINLNYKLGKFVEFDYKYGIDHYRFDYMDFIKNQLGTLTPGKGILPIAGELTKNRISETQQNSLASAFLRFDFQKDFGLKLPLSSTTQFAYDWRRKDFNDVEAIGTGYAIDPPHTLATANSSTIDELITKFVTFGYLINQKFDYANLAGASFGFRSDYSSAFGEGSKPFTFPRADAYLRLSELLKKDFIYELKLRAAYGEAGIQPNAYDRLITLRGESLSGRSLLHFPAISRNPLLSVEQTKEFEVGLDYGFKLNEGLWFSRLSGSTSYWTRKSFGSIFQIDTPPSTGALGITTNAIDLSSNGFQLSLDVNVMASRSLEWTFGTRFSKSLTMVDRIELHQPLVIGASGSGQTVIKEGYPVGAFFGTSPLSSLNQTNSQGVRYISEQDASNFEVVNGMVVNRTSKQVQFTTEQDQIGDATPKFSMSFFNDFVIYNNLSLSFQIDWVHGAQAYNQTRQWLYRDRIHKDFDEEVTIDGQTGAWVAFHSSKYQTNSTNKFFVEDASFVRLRNLAVSYDLSKLINSQYVKGFVVSFSGKNLFTITDYSGLDPEAVGTGLNDPLLRGIDLWSFPNMRSYQFGINLNF